MREASPKGVINMAQQPITASIFAINPRARSAAFVALATLAAALMIIPTAQAQTFSVLHNFTAGADGAYPRGELTIGPSGAVYGTAEYGGTYGNGTVFKLNQVNSAWVFSLLYEFTGKSDGAAPIGGVVFGPDGALYGTTQQGGYENNGTVFVLRPPSTFCRSITCYWNETVLHTFTGVPDGTYPWVENLIFDPAGNIYGTTAGGGTYDGGMAFELSPSGGGYTESILHSFGSGTDGAYPFAGVVFDAAGNLYGTTGNGGTGRGCDYGCGTAYQLVPSGGSWLENILVSFDLGEAGLAGAYFPYSPLVMDASGNLYGTTIYSTSNFLDGIVFKLAPSDGGFTPSVFYPFLSSCQPYGGVTMDTAGNFFGVCTVGAPGVFELTNCSQTCVLVDLHDFSGRDGDTPYGAPVLDADGNLYGTTEYGGTGENCQLGCGVVWEIAGVGAPRKK
jgi:uncharacterized repeat protein (TIGR03803 family)